MSPIVIVLVCKCPCHTVGGMHLVACCVDEDTVDKAAVEASISEGVYMPLDKALEQMPDTRDLEEMFTPMDTWPDEED
jgi:hypothetical protein